MGNITSSNIDQKQPESKQTFGQVIDYIATYYILTMDFQSLRKLYDKEYCDNLIVLTSDIIERYFNDLEVTYLAQRIKNGAEINEMDKNKVIFIRKDDLDNLNVSNSVKKKRLCVGIAKFYIKIAHVFAAIVTTINPVYVYKDATGNTIKKKLYEKEQIPPNVQRKLYKLGICNNRINSLKHGQDSDTETTKNIHPNVCSINTNSDGQVKSLSDEPGIPELMELYYDKYDYSSGNFIGMTEETQKQFRADLEKIYKIFTGNETMPDTIKTFSDIKLKDYHKLQACSGKDAILRKNIQLNKNEKEDKLKKKLFEDYAENLKQMIQTAHKTQDELLKIINDLFTYVIDPQTKKKRIIVNPKLSETSLQEVVVKSRKIIINLYLKCENDYSIGVKLYQAIVEKQIKDTTIKQINILEKETENLVNLEPKQKPQPQPQPQPTPILQREQDVYKNDPLNLQPTPQYLERPINYQPPLENPSTIYSPLEKPINYQPPLENMVINK